MSNSPDDPETSAAELSDLLEVLRRAPLAPLKIRNSIYRQAIDEFRDGLTIAFGPNQRASKEMARKRLSLGLNALYVFLKQLGLQNLSTEFDELRSALDDANRGVQHPLLRPSDSAGKRRDINSDPSQIWRARANIALAIEARHRLSKLDRTKDPKVKIAAREVISEHLTTMRQIMASRRGAITRGDVRKADEINDLVKMALGWRKNLSSRPSNTEAAELYKATWSLIDRSKSDKAMLQRIEKRCLTAAQNAGALKGRLETP
jgi:galactokinase/mevalonate kinase-like predicted kinase